jgi:hypothetical protein
MRGWVPPDNLDVPWKLKHFTGLGFRREEKAPEAWISSGVSSWTEDGLKGGNSF